MDDATKKLLDFMDSHKEEKTPSVLGLAAAIVLGLMAWLWLIPTIFVSYWKWFLVPLGVIPITHWYAFGLLCMCKLVHAFCFTQEIGSKNHMFERVLGSVIGLLCLWLIGYWCS